MNLRRLLLISFCLFIAQIDMASIHSVPSKERGDHLFRRKTLIDGNLVKTMVWNNGCTGRYSINNGLAWEWPKNSGKFYLAQTGLLVGTEIVDEDGVIQHIVAAHERSSPTGKSWSLEPVPGYLNRNSKDIAKSNEPSTWPPYWPDKMSDPKDPGWAGSWNGYFGKNQFNADQEVYFRCTDDTYDRYNYYPDSTDLTRRGTGFVISARVMQWSQVLVNDVVFILYEIKNDGTKDLPKTAVTVFVFDLVGGDGDSMDDHSEFDLIEDIAWCTDMDGRGNKGFGDDPVGVVATSFLETPGNPKDGIDNDGDGEANSPPVLENMLKGENPTDQIDNNGNGLIDENMTYVPFADQPGVGFRDRIDNDGDGEKDSPVITEDWLAGEINENAFDDNGNGIYDEDESDIGKAFADGIDNDGNGEKNSPKVTEEMIDVAANNSWHSYKVNSNIVLLDLGPEDLGKAYADGVDNDGNGAIDEGIDEGIDEMIDESRGDGIDNDGDWDPITDDVGIDGDPGTGDFGEGDGKPTSGWQPWGPNGEMIDTGFPGEPDIDKTDVSESDQLGLTNVQYQLSGSFDTNQDESMWTRWMIPGKFWDTSINTVNGDWDLFVSSGFFPIKAGETRRISMAVNMGNDREDALRNKDVAQKTYNTDYQFAKAPLIPTLTAVPGDHQVTLYWDNIAEESFDRYMADIGEPGADFEGYRIYRATDPAFEDAYTITDASGSPTYYKPIAQFDLKDEIVGLDSVGINGAHFNLGSDTGLRHSWVDTTVQNGETYYYAITAYDFGSTYAQIPPTETPILITTDATGKLKLGCNVVKITPNAPAAGYVPPTLGNIKLIAGSTTGWINYKIIDPTKVLDNHTYHITFEDTIHKNQLPTGTDTLTTKNFTLVDVTDSNNPDTLIDKSTLLNPEDELPITHGFQLSFHNEKFVALNRKLSNWNRDRIYNFLLQPFTYRFLKGMPKPSDYRITFGKVGIDTSTAFELSSRFTLPAKPVNFRVTNTSENRDIDFAFWEIDGNDGVFSANSQESDIIIFLEKDQSDSLIVTWKFTLMYDTTNANPQTGDVAEIIVSKPFLSSDAFEFTTHGGRIDKQLAKNSLDCIKVVPNPYVAAATWEARNPYTTGRGPRSLHFNHLPNKCTIRIFTVSGELVDTIEHDSPIDDGTEEWNLLTRDDLNVSYGIYIYYVDAPGIGQKIGKFAIIK